MIIFYAFGKDEKTDAIRQFMDKKGFSYRDIGPDLAHETLATLFEGQGTPQANPQAPQEAGICFSSDMDHEVSVRLLAAFERIGVFFTYKIQQEESNTHLPIADLFQAQQENEDFIKALRQLQELIEATAQLQEEDYDPDRWSELKFAVADANDFFSTLVAKEFDPSDDSIRNDIDRYCNELRKALDRLIDA